MGMPVKPWRVACVQMNATADPSRNLSCATAFAEKAVRQGAHLIAFPENFYWRGPAEFSTSVAHETPKVLKYFQAFAKKNRVAILLGSLLEKSPVKK